MSKKFYVTTKLFVGGRRLIGILSEVDGQFRFEYKLGDKQRESFCYLDEFPDQDKIYVGAEVEEFIFGIIPKVLSNEIEKMIVEVNEMKPIVALNKSTEKVLKAYRKNKQNLFSKKRKLNRISHKIEKLEKQIKEKRFKIC